MGRYGHMKDMPQPLVWKRPPAFSLASHLDLKGSKAVCTVDGKLEKL